MDEVIKVRQCARCYFVFPSHKTKCPACGLEVDKKERDIDTVAGTLEQIQDEKLYQKFKEEQEKISNKIERGRANSLEALQALAKKRGYKPGWARYVWETRKRKKSKSVEDVAWQMNIL